MTEEEVTEEEYQEYQEHLQNLKNNEEQINLQYNSDSKFSSDEMKYTKDIIQDDFWALIEAEKYLETLFLTRKTVDALKRLIRISTSYETVLNNYSKSDINKEKLGLKLSSIFVNMGVSGLEKKYNDVDAMVIANIVHHRTKVIRGGGGFERNVQKTNIVKSATKSILGKEEEEKTGISRHNIRNFNVR